MRKFVVKIAGWGFEDVEAEDMAAAAVAYIEMTGMQPPPRSQGRPLAWVHESDGTPSIGAFYLEWSDGAWKAVPR